MLAQIFVNFLCWMQPRYFLQFVMPYQLISVLYLKFSNIALHRVSLFGGWVSNGVILLICMVVP